MSQYIISPQAIRDLEDISDYFADRSVEAGENLFNEFSKKCRYLAQFPKMGRSYGSIRQGLRGLPLNGHIIFYRVLENGIEIMRVLRGDRNFESLFGEEN